MQVIDYDASHVKQALPWYNGHSRYGEDTVSYCRQYRVCSTPLLQQIDQLVARWLGQIGL